MNNWGLTFGICFCYLLTNAQQNKSAHLKFKKNQFLLTEQIGDQLDSLYRNTQEATTLTLLLESPYDTPLAQYDKWTLLKQRAIVVEQYLEERFLQAEDVYIKYAKYPQIVMYKPVAAVFASGKLNLADYPSYCTTISNRNPNKIVTPYNTEISFPTGAFESQDLTIIGDEINICVYEFYDRKSLVRSNLTTHSGHQGIETAGSFYIVATSSKGKALRLVDGKKYTIKINYNLPDNTAGFYTFYGQEQGDIINWFADQDASVSSTFSYISEVTSQSEYEESVIQYEIESLEETDALLMKSSQLGWINCDRFIEEDNLTSVNIWCEGYKDMSVRMIFEEYKSVLPGYQKSNDQSQYEFKNVPEGQPVILLAYKVVGKEVFFHYQKVVIGEQFNQKPQMQQADLNGFYAMLDDVIVD